MTLTHTKEHDELRSALRRLLADKSPSAAVRRWMESGEGYDPALWRQLAGQLGLMGIAVPEEYGGSGGGAVELGVVLEELGRALLPSPYFATVALAGQALTASGDAAAKARWLPGIASGELTATVAVAEGSGSWRIEDVATTATRVDGESWTVSGTKVFVVDGDTAGLLLVVADTDAGPGLFAVESGVPGVARTPLDTLDPTRRQARIDLDEAPAVHVGPDGDATAYLRTALDLAAVALASEQVGGAQACLDAAVEYAKTRVQFERPIGSFQAVKHACADMLLAVEAARSAAHHAASVAAGESAREPASSPAEEPAEEPAELPAAAALAAAYCAGTYTHAAKQNIQIHGGIGYTWEHDAHLHLRRAKTSEQLLGAPAAHRARLADLVGI
ncbi:acyl-CoA dehydrogenase family protein [Streptomyces sp. NPDC002088]|uniref:acyl-CoA dehydrogenase family protein n=1 Tax=Streptomyces sp. NPDC002088 TaxID=3154665 RepID=UPI00332D2C45